MRKKNGHHYTLFKLPFILFKVHFILFKLAFWRGK